jgi:type I pantothenate kinase
MAIDTTTDGLGASQFVAFTREEWASLRDQMPMPLTEAELFALRGLNDQVTLSQVEQVYLPLSRLLNLYVAATQRLHAARDTFLGTSARVPYVIGVAGSVAVGKSTAARILQALLSQWPAHPRVDLVTTDGFLLPNSVLESRGLMHRKGFPESYDVRRLLEFVIAVKSGEPSVKAPVYSHLSYDITPGTWQEVNRPDIMIIEGLNVLQTGPPRQGRSLFVSDFFDFSIYIDAPEALIEAWYIDRFMTLRETVFTDAKSYFHRYASLTDAEARETAQRIWREINYVNLKENVEPTRERAHFILEKGADHDMARVRLRKL